MDTRKMIAEIKSTCTTLERTREELMDKVKDIDDRLTAYHMAIDSLELTIPAQTPVEMIMEDKPIGELPEKIGRRTVLELNGRKQTVNEWAKELHMSPDGIQYRLAHGWSVQDALSKVSQPGKTVNARKTSKPRKVFAYDKHGNVIRQYVGVGDAARDLNMPASTIEKIIAKMTRDDQLRVRDYYLAYVA